MARNVYSFEDIKHLLDSGKCCPLADGKVLHFILCVNSSKRKKWNNFVARTKAELVEVYVYEYSSPKEFFEKFGKDTAQIIKSREIIKIEYHAFLDDVNLLYKFSQKTGRTMSISNRSPYTGELFEDAI